MGVAEAGDDPRWALAIRAAALLAVDPIGLGGAVLRGPLGPMRDLWLDYLRSLRPFGSPWRRMPPQIADGRLIGGLDLAATLAAGRPVAERGLLAQCDDGILIVPMAERLRAGASSHIGAALDRGEVLVEREGLALRAPARITAILLDEGIDDEHAPASLTERVAFLLDSANVRPGDVPPATGDDIEAARRRHPHVAVGDDVIEALSVAGAAFGVPSLRLASLALRVAKASAALAGHDTVRPDDAELAAALVFAPRATQLPAAEPDDDQHADPPPEEPDDQAADDASRAEGETQPLSDSVVEATRAAIPADLLAALSAAAALPKASAQAGRAGATRQGATRGRPAGVRRGAPGHGARLAVVETLRAAAPWQPLRRREYGKAAPGRILIRREDFRVGRFKEKTETLTIFVVDASGSAALHRLAEVKGAVELVLAECYVRRDAVALIAFRGDRAELVLPPTRSLVRAKRALAGQPGGGGTPLAAAIEAAGMLAFAARKKGQVPMVVFLTDGKANVARSGAPGRAAAEADAAAAAQAFRLVGASGLVLDIAPRPGAQAQRLAATMAARYIPLPYADAQAMSRAVLAVAPAA